jgi:hypothetical protein
MRKIEQRLYDDRGRVFDLLECGHALYQNHRWSQIIFRRCPICAAIVLRADIPAWIFDTTFAIDNPKEAILEGKRQLALTHFKTQGKKPSKVLLTPRYDIPLFEDPVMTPRKVHFEGGCGLEPGARDEKRITTKNLEEVNCIICMRIASARIKGKRKSWKKVHYQDCDGQILCTGSRLVRSTYPLVTRRMEEVTCKFCERVIYGE